MSDSLALRSAPMPAESAKPAAKFSLRAMVTAALESLVASHTAKTETVSPLSYRYPPI